MLHKMKDRLAQEEVLQNFISNKIKKHEETYNEQNNSTSEKRELAQSMEDSQVSVAYNPTLQGMIYWKW